MTIAPPIIVKSWGLSLMKAHTHKGPSMVSKSIIILTFDAGVILAALDSNMNDTGRIIKPVIDM